MTFAALETSDQDSISIALYRLKWGNTMWHYTSAARAYTRTEGGVEVTYIPLPMSDSGMVQGGSSNNDLTVTCPVTIPLVGLFASTPPATPIWLTVRVVQLDDPDEEAPIRWIGTVSNVKRNEGDASALIVGKTLLASMSRSGLRLAWTRGCPHMLYDSECRADKNDFAVTTTITAMTGGSITVADVDGHAAGWFDGGFIEWEASAEGTIDRRGIQSSATDTELVLLGTTYRLEVDMEVTLYPGCNLTTDNCLNKFDNLANFGGFEQMSGKNPFDGTAII